MPQALDEIIQVRKDKLKKIEEMGVNPFPPIFEKSDSVGECKNLLGKSVRTAGRLMSLRTHGKVTFADLKDETGKIQLMLKEDELGNQKYKFLDLIDIGDHLGVSGTVINSQTGETTISVGNYELLAKSLRPLPSQWYGFKNEEEKYRKRYLDMLLNDEVKKNLDTRWLLERKIREFLWSQKFVEVETPILQNLYGGTNAKPFTTHLNALDQDMYLRVAPELYLKRLIVGGYERVFEIARNFRNEGMDQVHQPEFTMLEWYITYADYFTVMNLVEEMMKFLAKEILGTTMISIKNKKIEIGNPWPKLTMKEAVKQYLQIDWDKISDKDLSEELKRNGVKVTGVSSRNKNLFSLFDHLVTEKLDGPVWIIDYPREVSPLSKEHRNDPENFVERFEGYMAGEEIFDGWSEITSGIEQRKRFENEQKNMKAGDSEAQPLDEDFLETLEYGMPPLGGIGFGIDRLTMLFTQTEGIRDVIAFPLLRPEKKSQNNEVKKTFSIGPKLTITRDQALKLLHEKMQNENLRRHSLSVEAVMRALAKHFGGDEDKWGILGLLHDGDYELTKDNMEKHTLIMLDWLKNLGETDEELVQALQSHNAPATGFPGPVNLMEWSLFCCDELTGLIVAVALTRPSKSLSEVTVESVMKKWKQKGFATGAKREDIEMCVEKLGIPLNEFIQLALSAMQRISSQLDL